MCDNFPFSQDENDGEWEEETEEEYNYSDDDDWEFESDESELDRKWSRRQDKVDQKRRERTSNMIDGNVKSLQDICSREILRFGECTSSRYKFDELYIEELPLPRLFKSSLSDWIKTWYNVESELDYSDDSDIYTDGSGWDEAD